MAADDPKMRNSCWIFVTISRVNRFALWAMRRRGRFSRRSRDSPTISRSTWWGPAIAKNWELFRGGSSPAGVRKGCLLESHFIMSTEAIKVIINGQEFQVPKGARLIDVCRDKAFDIPSFCYYADLALQASCRMCLVRIEKMPKLQTS